MSAAQAAGYAMAAEDQMENRVQIVRARPSTAIAVRVERAPIQLSAFFHRMWHRGWFADHWPGRATA
jgi:hypothetical protein